LKKTLVVSKNQIKNKGCGISPKLNIE